RIELDRRSHLSVSKGDRPLVDGEHAVVGVDQSDRQIPVQFERQFRQVGLYLASSRYGITVVKAHENITERNLCPGGNTEGACVGWGKVYEIAGPYLLPTRGRHSGRQFDGETQQG